MLWITCALETGNVTMEKERGKDRDRDRDRNRDRDHYRDQDRDRDRDRPKRSRMPRRKDPERYPRSKVGSKVKVTGLIPHSDP